MASNEGMQDLIRLINVLQDAASTGGMNIGQLDLPQIAVIGEQSTGKSSVLENFVGRDFLPRGSGIVTRRPLVLQLNYNENEEYAEFLHLPDKRFSNFLDVRQEIQAETDRVTQGKGVSSLPINLRIYSPNVLDLTLVDLPGITQVSVGDQPQDISMQIREMVQEYISHDNTLILAVTPANQDLANSSALKLAKTVDPEGIRTIGVVTKLDIMDKGTDAREILENKILPLRRGYIGLVNRSQEDIDKNKDIQMAQQAEMNFFRSQDAYRHMADRMGIKYLQQILNEQLCEHIQDKMPVIKANLKKQYQVVSKELEEMQAFADEKSDVWKQSSIIRLMQRFTESFRVFIEGHSPKANGTQMNAGARINHCIYGQIFKLLDQMRAPSEKELKILIRNEHGKRNALFVSELVIDVVVCQLLQHYSEPMNKSVELASEIISSTIAELSKEFSSYPRLKDAVQSLLAEKLKTNEAETKKHLQFHLKAQAAFINTKHPEFQRIIERADIPADFNPSMSFQEGGVTLTRSDSNSSLNSSTSGFDRSPRPGRKETMKPEILQTGWMTVFPKGIAFPSKRFWCRLTNDTFMWYANDNIRNPITKKDKAPISSIHLEELQLVINSQTGQFSLEMPGRSASQKLKSLIVAFGTQTEEDEWYEAFQNVGLEKENSSKATTEDWVSVAVEVPAINKRNERPQQDPARKEPSAADIQTRRHLYETVDKDSEIQESYDKIIYMIYSYMKIVDRTVHDLVPKYIYLLLVDETTEYTTKDLLADLLEDENWKDFLEVSPRELGRRERLYSFYKSTKDAMDMLSAVDIPTA